jgi:isoleucyl-tRNA synthetase
MVNDRVNFSQEEEKILNYWNQIQAFETSYERNKDKPLYTFYDGPPFATGLPHYGHILAGTIKDTVTRFAHQTGHNVRRVFGFDTHGLPIEYEIDQMLNIKTRQQVLEMGIDKYNNACRGIVERYTAEWETTVKRMGRWIDFRNAYKTMDLNFMESVWWVFKQLYEKNLVYKGYKVMPYSTGCTTSLSNFEAGQNYKDVSDPAVVVSFPLVDSPNVAFVAWTTTPWTLPSNIALAVNPTLRYVRLRDKKTEAEYWMGKDRISELYPTKGQAQPTKKSKNDTTTESSSTVPEVPTETNDYIILEEKSGSELSGIKYVPVFDYFVNHPRAENFFKIITGNHVTADSGTCIVHCAPGFGEEDYSVCLEHNIIRKDEPVISPVDESGCFTAEVVDFKGRYVKESDKDIIRNLKDRKRLVKNGTIVHSYPFCWRSDTALLYKTVPSWFVSVEQLKDKLLANNEQTYWVPSFVKEKRFHNWLRDARDWAISRTRYWGTPIPLWISPDGEEIVVVGSIEELKQLTGEQNITDLHKDKIDHLTIPSKRGPDFPPLKRIEDVFDCWFESGAMPYAQIHYPFENQHIFENGFPADFIAEGLDQTRGWFYTLMVLSTALYDKPPFRNLIVNGLVLAEDGKKMSKRLKNYPDPLEVVKVNSADSLRLYLINSPVVRAEPLAFKQTGVHEVVKSVFLPWFHAYRFWVEQAKRFENQTGKPFVAQPISNLKLVELMDIWIVSSFQSLVAFVHTEMNAYRLYTVVPRLLQFIGDLTNWYVRMNRKRLKSGDETSLNSLFYVLYSLCQVMGPFTPYFVEYLYQNLKNALPESERVDSVHYLEIPVVNESLRNAEVETTVARMQTAIELGRQARNNRLITLKQPLRHILICHPSAACLNDLRTLTEAIQSELNVRTVEFSNHPEEYITLSALPDRRKLGLKYGSKSKKINEGIMKITNDDISALQKDGEILVEGEKILLEEIEIKWNFRGNKDIQESVRGDDMLIILDVVIDDQLRKEAKYREIVREVQILRKASNLSAMDPVDIYYAVNVKDGDASATNTDNLDWSQVVQSPDFTEYIVTNLAKPFTALANHPAGATADFAALPSFIAVSTVELSPNSSVTIHLFRP